jgi:myo-inositol-1(or 4)-monophosphatase
MRDLLPIAIEAVRRARTIVREQLPGTVTVKSDRDTVTEIDYAVERTVRDFLLRESPEIGFLGEEDGRFGAADTELTWVLDPLDGTANLVHGIPLCGISLGLVRRDRPVLGVIDLPLLDLVYSAYEGGGAFRGQDRIGVSSAARLADAVVSLGDYAVGEDAAPKNAERLRVTAALAAVVERVRMLGSAAIDLAWVADGRLGASIMLNNNPWDTAAGVLIAREAGAIVVDRRGQEHTMASASTLAVAPGVLAELLGVLRAA